MDKDKQISEVVEVEWTSTDTSETSSDDEAMAEAIRRSKFEDELRSNRNGAGTSGEAAERSRPATTSGDGILSIPPIARLTKPPRRLSSESFLRTSNPRSSLTEEDLSAYRGRFGFPNEVQLRLPFPNERADTVSEGWICMYALYFECGLRLPLPPLLVQTMNHYQLAIPQLMPNGMRVFLGLIVLAEEAKVELTVEDILAMYYPQENAKDHGRFSMYPRRKKQVVGEMKNADRYWQDRYFFMHVNARSMGGLADAFYPLWGSLRKELRKPPPKASNFEEKLEKLLALPNREWDDICQPARLRASSLWKDFVDIPTGIVKRLPSWVDWPFVVRAALRRLYGEPIFLDPLTDEEAVIAEEALDRMEFKLPSPKDMLAQRRAQAKAAKEAAKAAAAEEGRKGSEPIPFPVLESSPEPPAETVAEPPAKKRKSPSRSSKKAPAKRSKKSKVMTPEADAGPSVAPSGPSVEPTDLNVEPSADRASDEGEKRKIELTFPPGTCIFESKEASTALWRQIYARDESDVMSSGRNSEHMDEILWDGLKSNLRAIGLFCRITDRLSQQQVELRKLEDRDERRGRDLAAIDAKFREVKASTDGLVGDLQKVIEESKAGVESSRAIARAFEEAQERIKVLEAEKAAADAGKAEADAEKQFLMEKVLSIHEEATFKARYDVLKEFRQGTLVPEEVDEEIEMFELLEGEGAASTLPDASNVEHPASGTADEAAEDPAERQGEPGQKTD